MKTTSKKLNEPNDWGNMNYPEELGLELQSLTTDAINATTQMNWEASICIDVYSRFIGIEMDDEEERVLH